MITITVAAAIFILIWFRTVFDHHQGTAAWVQAVGSLLIIGATAWIASQKSWEFRERDRLERRRLKESVAILARSFLASFQIFLRELKPTTAGDPRGALLRTYAPTDFEVAMDGLAQVPLHQIDDADLITLILRLRGLIAHLKKHLDDAKRDPIGTFDPELVRSFETPMFNVVAGILRSVYGSSIEDELSKLAAKV